uniref:Epiplakin 1 n=1 Tax=Gallus gallus TaxID=9031 RepID=A0A8V0Y6V9_CHICK
MDKHKVFQKELGKRAGCMKMLKRSVRELTRSSSSSSSSSGGGCSGGCGSGVDAQRLQLQMEELSARWEAVCGMSVCKQGRLEAAMRQAEEFHALVHSFLGRLSEAEKTLKYGLGPPEERSAQQCQLQLQGSANGASCSCRAVPASIAGQCQWGQHPLQGSAYIRCRAVPIGPTSTAGLCQWGQLQLQGSANGANIHCRAVPMGPISTAGQCQWGQYPLQGCANGSCCSCRAVPIGPISTAGQCQ